MELLIAAGSAVGGYLLKYAFDRRSSNAAEIMAKKRQLYIDLLLAMDVFIDRVDGSADNKKAFLEHYPKIWLWASDDVIRSLNAFLAANRKAAAGDSIPADTLKRAFAACVLSMRQDLRWRTRMRSDEYEFVSF